MDKPPISQSGLSPLTRTYVSVSVAVILGVLLIGLIGLQAGRQMDSERDVEAALRQSHARRTELQTLLALLQDAEAGKRGYTITGDVAFLEPYRKAQTEIDPVLDRLAAQYGPQSAALAPLRRFVAEERSTLQGGLSSQAPRGVTTEAVGDLGAATRSMRRVQDEVSALSTREAASLAQLRVRSAERVRGTRDAVLGLGILAAALMIGAGLIILRFLRHQQALVATVASTARRQEAVFDGSRTPLLILTQDARITQVNAATERLFGWTRAELAGQDISLLIDPTGPGDAVILERLANRRGYLEVGVEGTLCGLRRDGTRFTADISVSPVGSGADSIIIAAVRDVSEQRRVEELKSQFVSTVSHELRTPLTSIAGSLGLLAGGAAGPLPEKAARLIFIAQSNSQRLVRLINDILDIEKIDAGEMALRHDPVEIRDLAQRSIDSVRGMAEEFGVGISLAAGAPATVTGDLDRLIQVVVNLLSNAIKFSPRDGQIMVTAEPTGALARITVSDRGAGIPEAFRSRVFDKFAQADASDNRQRGGTGLGLAISREIAERHGGRLWFASIPGEGATFHLDLPLRAAAQIAPPLADGPPQRIMKDAAPDADAAPPSPPRTGPRPGRRPVAA